MKLNTNQLNRLVSQLLDRNQSIFENRKSIPTNWFVVTGTTSSGKSTLTREIARSEGLHWYEEPARVYYEKCLESGQTLSEIWDNVQRTIAPIHQLRVNLEESLATEELHLLDTAIPDTLPYALLCGAGVESVWFDSAMFRYREPIFLLEPLDFESDRIRKEDADERAALHYLRKKIYENLGYEVVSINWKNLEKRKKMVLRYIKGN